MVDAQTFLIPAFSYDGQAPDAHFWVGKGNRPGPEGNFVADENGSDEPLRKYHKKTLVIVLPGDSRSLISVSERLEHSDSNSMPLFGQMHSRRL